jgi:hypothetical protein
VLLNNDIPVLNEIPTCGKNDAFNVPISETEKN